MAKTVLAGSNTLPGAVMFPVAVIVERKSTGCGNGGWRVNPI
jgi:hypothetical protein